MFEAPPHRCEPRHNPGFGEIRSECALSARNGRSGQNPNCGVTDTKNAAVARLAASHALRRALSDEGMTMIERIRFESEQCRPSYISIHHGP